MVKSRYSCRLCGCLQTKKKGRFNMFCTNCGKELPEGTKVCTACNAVLDDAPGQEPLSTSHEEPVFAASQPNATHNVVNNFYQEKKQPVSVLGWIGRSLISCIPFVGGIIYLVMLFIWSGDKSKEESFNNWAKAQLILMAIGLGLGLVIGIIILIITLATAGSIASSYGTMY